MLTRRSVDVLPVRIAGSAARVTHAMTLLSSDERARCAAFQTQALQSAYALRRAALRAVLAQRTGIAPTELRFTYGAHGKPSLEPATELSFNATSSGDLAVIAIGAGGELGIDVERVRAFPEMLDVAAVSFAPADADGLAHRSGAERDRAFFTLWTRNEARLKAMGLGLSGTAVAGHDDAWTIRDVPLDTEYACALAYRDPALRVVTHPVVEVEVLLASEPKARG